MNESKVSPSTPTPERPLTLADVRLVATRPQLTLEGPQLAELVAVHEHELVGGQLADPNAIVAQIVADAIVAQIVEVGRMLAALAEAYDDDPLAGAFMVAEQALARLASRVDLLHRNHEGLATHYC